MVYKFFDDQGVYLAVVITYYAFVAVVPLLLLATSVLGFLLADDPGLRARIVDSAVANFPVVGDQLGRPEGLQGSTGAVILGGALALYGALGLGTAVQNALHTAWAVPRNSRPDPIRLRLRSLGLLLAGGVSMAALTFVSAAAQVADNGLTWLGGVRGAVVPLATFTVMVGILAVLLRLGADRRHDLRGSLPGAVLIAAGWHAVQFSSTSLVQHSLKQASSMNQTFGLVLGLLGVAYLLAVILVLGIEVNVVLRRRLWPRALLTPFTDAVVLTDGDKRAYAGYARAQRHKGFEAIAVRFKARRKKDDQRRPR
ncbi:YihY/virulence factor BrkB family protein [Marmoricola sp. OAE513]|uniref:YihY/virulence factor BrkB family protein n=1 Tax=Marmoricola sp. OAE513 TaxID=2817894 RepID=UPI001DAECBE0